MRQVWNERAVVSSWGNTRVPTKRHGWSAGSLVETCYEVTSILKVGSTWGVFGVFRNQNNRGSSGAYVTCIHCGLSVKINTRWNAARRAKIVDAIVLCFLFVCLFVCLFLRVWSEKNEYPNYTRSGIALVYLWCIHTMALMSWFSQASGAPTIPRWWKS